MVVDSIQTLDPINTWSEQKVKLNDAEHKLKDQGQDELGISSSDDEDDNISD
ncbi:hypothetical protein AHAS_Ahas16G0197500 [Arachis hypogaea]